jgi:membrane protease YdiL (CAAX protease family)
MLDNELAVRRRSLREGRRRARRTAGSDSHAGAQHGDRSMPSEPKDTASRSPVNKGEPPKRTDDTERTLGQLWFEVVAVLCLAYVPDQFNSVWFLAGRILPCSSSVDRMLLLIVRSVQVSLPVLLIVSLSKSPWSLFGIARLRWLFDSAVGCLVLIVTLFCNDLVLFRVATLFPSSITPREPMPIGITGYALLVVGNCANAFAEELVMRGYLIARFERLLPSAWQAVLISTLLFAGYHIYQGPLGAISAMVFGLVSGISFCLFRRLWPLCIAHALLNILIWI